MRDPTHMRHAGLGARRRRDAGLRLGRLRRGGRRGRWTVALERRSTCGCPAATSRSACDLAISLTGTAERVAELVLAELARRARARALTAAVRRRAAGASPSTSPRARTALVAEARAARPRRDLARRRRPRPAALAGGAGGAGGARRGATTWHGYPTNRGLPELREAVAALLRHALRGRARSGARDHSAARRQGGARAPLPGAARPGRRGARGRSRLSRSTSAGRRSPAPSRSGCRCGASTASCPTSTPSPADVAGAPTCSSAATPTTRRVRVVDVAFHERLAAWGLQHGVPICHDNAYSEITFDGVVAPSFLEAPGAREAGIEISRSPRRFSMPGWRVAFAVGNAELVGRLLRAEDEHRRRHVARRSSTPRSARWTAIRRERRALREHLRRCAATCVCDRLEAAGVDVPRPGGAHVRVDAGARRRRSGRSPSACCSTPTSSSRPAGLRRRRPTATSGWR